MARSAAAGISSLSITSDAITSVVTSDIVIIIITQKQ